MNVSNHKLKMKNNNQMSKKRNLVVYGMLIVIVIGFVSFFNCNSSTPSNMEVNSENLAALETNQNMVTKEFKIFSDFIYDIGPRFGPIKKSEIENITSISAFLDDEALQNMVSIKSTSIILVQNDSEFDTIAKGNSRNLTKTQLQVLQSATYSTNFGLRVEYEERDPQSGSTFDSYRSPYLTIVPEVQATYSDGKDALKLFLKESCQSVLVDVDPEKLKPAKLYFTVTKDGILENISLDRDSGYPEVDKKMIELIKKTPGIWTPAKNSKGENVDQELVVSFGLMGC